jgi:hypothetical protein
LNWFYFFAGDIGGDNAGAGGEIDFEKGLGLIFDGEFDFGEGFSFDGHERGYDGAFCDGGEDTAVREAGPRESEGRGFVRLAMVTKGGLQRETGK